MRSLLRELTLRVGFSYSSVPDGGLLSDPVAPFLVETFEVPMWMEFFSVLSLDRVLLTSSLSSPGHYRPGLSWLPLLGFDFAGLVVWCFLLRPVVPLRLLASPHSSVCAMRVWGPPLFPLQEALLG